MLSNHAKLCVCVCVCVCLCSCSQTSDPRSFCSASAQHLQTRYDFLANQSSSCHVDPPMSLTQGEAQGCAERRAGGFPVHSSTVKVKLVAVAGAAAEDPSVLVSACVSSLLPSWFSDPSFFQRGNFCPVRLSLCDVTSQ